MFQETQTENMSLFPFLNDIRSCSLSFQRGCPEQTLSDMVWQDIVLTGSELSLTTNILF